MRGNWSLGLIVPVQDPTPFSPFSPGEWPRSLERTHHWGYRVVELAITDPSVIDPEKIEENLTSVGLKPVALTTGQAFWKEGLFLSVPDETMREKAITRIKTHMTLAQRLDAVVIIGLLRGKEGKKELLQEALKECARFKSNVRLALEPLNRYETSLVNTVAEALELIDAVGAENLGILFDTFHANIEEASLREAIELGGERLFHVHLADSNRWIPGFGHLRFPEVWEGLENIGYCGNLVLECWSRPDPGALFPAEKVRKRVGL